LLVDSYNSIGNLSYNTNRGREEMLRDVKLLANTSLEDFRIHVCLIDKVVLTIKTRSCKAVRSYMT